MKIVCICILLPLISFWSDLSQARSEEVSDASFSLGEVKIAQTTFDEIQAQFGKGNVIRGKSEDSPVEICYASGPNGKNTFVIFETGPMGGFIRVTGFRVTTIDPKTNCAQTSVNLMTLSTANGVLLHLSKQEFLAKLPFPFKRRGAFLKYEAQSKREASKEELEKMRATWPKETQTYFDVMSTIEARFDKDRLIGYYASKIESY